MNNEVRLNILDGKFISYGDDFFANKIRAAEICIMVGHPAIAIFIIIRTATRRCYFLDGGVCVGCLFGFN